MQINGYDVKIGASIVGFTEAGGKLVPAQTVSSVGKGEKIKASGGKFGVTPDGLGVAIDVAPSSDLSTFISNIANLEKSLKYGFNVKFSSTAKFGVASLKTVTSFVPSVPMYDAYTGLVSGEKNSNLIVGEGNIHISWKKIGNKSWPADLDPMEPTHFEACRALTKTLDAYLGIPSIVFDDGDKARGTVYGKAGQFRPRSYGDGYHGMEYCTLSNAWLNRPSTRDLVFSNAIDAFTALLADYEIADRKYAGGLASTMLADWANPSTKTTAASILMSNSYIKSPRFYREAREKTANKG